MSPTGAVIATYKLCLAYVSIPIVETGQVHLSLSFSHILCLSVGMVGRKSRLSLGSSSPHQLAPGRPVSTPRSSGAPGRACTPPRSRATGPEAPSLGLRPLLAGVLGGGRGAGLSLQGPTWGAGTPREQPGHPRALSSRVSETLRGARWQLLGAPDVPGHVRRVFGRAEPRSPDLLLATGRGGNLWGSPVAAACCQRPARGSPSGSQPAARGRPRSRTARGPSCALCPNYRH